MQTPVRADALPEYHAYVDEGCEHYPRCLACPLDRCRYDVVGGIRVLRNGERDPAMAYEYWELGRPVGAIACRYGVSKRTVSRVVAALGRAP